MAEVSGLLLGLQWVVLEDTRYWGVDVKTIDLAFTVSDGRFPGAWGMNPHPRFIGAAWSCLIG